MVYICSSANPLCYQTGYTPKMIHLKPKKFKDNQYMRPKEINNPIRINDSLGSERNFHSKLDFAFQEIDEYKLSSDIMVNQILSSPYQTDHEAPFRELNRNFHSEAYILFFKTTRRASTVRNAGQKKFIKQLNIVKRDEVVVSKEESNLQALSNLIRPTKSIFLIQIFLHLISKIKNLKSKERLLNHLIENMRPFPGMRVASAHSIVNNRWILFEIASCLDLIFSNADHQY